MSEDSSKSFFNAGVAQVERIDALQRALNGARFNLLAFNSETMTPNYETFLNSLDGLFSESWSKLNKDEKKEGLKMKQTIREFLQMFPIIEVNVIRGKEEKSINYANFKKLLPMLDLYERKIKEYLDEHSFNSPNRDDDDDF